MQKQIKRESVCVKNSMKNEVRMEVINKLW